jgi:RND family efflux transporter MFP subunit
LPFLDALDVQSTLEAIREVRLAPEVAGRLVAMPMAEGEAVRPGQPLFALDQIQLQASVNADAAEARKDQVNAERYIFLNQQGAVSTKDRDFYVTQAIQARDKLRANIATLGYKNVLSPIGGIVGNINYKLGDVVQAGAVITSIIDNSRLWVRLDIPGEQAYRVRPGLPVVIKAPDDPRQLLARGAVTFVAPSIDKDKQTLLVKATFDNADGALRNGQRVNATLVFSQAASLAVPQQAVLLQAGLPPQRWHFAATYFCAACNSESHHGAGARPWLFQGASVPVWRTGGLPPPRNLHWHASQHSARAVSPGCFGGIASTLAAASGGILA